MITIGFLEGLFHSHVLYYTSKIANPNRRRIIIFTTEQIRGKIADKLADENIQWVLKKSDESLRKFLNRVEQIYANEIDLLIVNSISGFSSELLRFTFFDPPCKRIFWMRDLKAWLEPKFVVDGGIIQTIERNLQTLFRRRILPKYDGLLVANSLFKSYIEENTEYDGSIYHLPRVFYEGSDDMKVTPPITFTIPGTVIYRREYRTFLHIFREIFTPDDPVNLQLLGAPNRSRVPEHADGFCDQVLQQCKEMEDEGYSILYFEDEYAHAIPQSTFSERIMESDVLINPIREKHIKKGTGRYERIGKTTGSGIVFDALGYGKPLLLPEFYPVGDEMREQVWYYANAKDLRQSLTELSTDSEKLHDRKRTSVENSKRFTLHCQQERFDNIINEI